MDKNYEELVAEAKAQVEHTSAETVHEALRSGEDITVVDVREPDEYEVEHIPEGKLIPGWLLEHQASEQLPDKDARIVTHCGAGARGSLAAKSLMEMGYTNVANLEGGLNAWREKGYETE
ncbi:MAG TPA: rhodanese-like domain-containing protein [Rubrobacter sp.]|nr:rhodanese-like domain-containing protein [Rubrobacter sp.]